MYFWTECFTNHFLQYTQDGWLKKGYSNFLWKFSIKCIKINANFLHSKARSIWHLIENFKRKIEKLIAEHKFSANHTLFNVFHSCKTVYFRNKVLSFQYWFFSLTIISMISDYFSVISIIGDCLLCCLIFKPLWLWMPMCHLLIN